MNKTMTITIVSDGMKYSFRQRVSAVFQAARYIWGVTSG